MPKISVTPCATMVSTNASDGVILWTPWVTVRLGCFMSVIVILAWVTLRFYFTLVGMRNVIKALADSGRREPAPGNPLILTAFALRRVKG